MVAAGGAGQVQSEFFGDPGVADRGARQLLLEQAEGFDGVLVEAGAVQAVVDRDPVEEVQQLGVVGSGQLGDPVVGDQDLAGLVLVEVDVDDGDLGGLQHLAGQPGVVPGHDVAGVLLDVDGAVHAVDLDRLHDRVEVAVVVVLGMLLDVVDGASGARRGRRGT